MSARQATAPRWAGPTHFLCIPLARRQLARHLGAFRAAVTDVNSFALPPDAIRPPGTMHLTLGVMSLTHQAQLNRAVALLRNLKPREILAGVCGGHQDHHPHGGTLAAPTRPPRLPQITLKGLQAMQDASKTGVLYAPPLDLDGGGGGGGGSGSGSSVLYAFCMAVRQVFIDAGMMEAENRPLVLHATVVNTTYVKGRNGARRKERMMLDARQLLSLYEDYVWLDRHEVRTLALCKMGAKPVGNEGDEAYEVVAEITI